MLTPIVGALIATDERLLLVHLALAFTAGHLATNDPIEKKIVQHNYFNGFCFGTKQSI